MKKYIMFLTLCLFCQELLAQDSVKAVAKIHYEFKHIDDTRQPDNPYVEDVFVLLSPNVSIQKSQTVLGIVKSINDMVYNPKRNEKGMVVFGVPTTDKDASSYEYFNDRRKKTFSIFNNIYDTFYVMDQDYPKIDWELLDEQKQIGGYNCQKAKGKWGGRIYNAWFTLEIQCLLAHGNCRDYLGLSLRPKMRKKKSAGPMLDSRP